MGKQPIDNDRIIKHGFIEIDHTADYALKVFGKTLEDLFTAAARGITHLIHADDLPPPFPLKKNIDIVESSIEELLVEWLSQIAFWAETEGYIGANFQVRLITPLQLEGFVNGRISNEIDRHIKAVTYHKLEIKHDTHGFFSTVIFDV